MDAVLRRTLTESLEDTLRDEILRNSLKPGARLRVAALSRRYSVSATPVRESLQRLSEQGLVTLDPQVGARVAAVSIEDMRDVYDMRMLIEGDAVRRAVLAGDAAWVEHVVDEWKKFRAVEERISQGVGTQHPSDWVNAHRCLHMAILEASESPWEIRFLQTLYDHSARYQALLRSSPDAVSESISEHEEIVGAVLRRDADGAVAAIRAQFLIAVRRIEHQYEEGFAKAKI